MNIKDLIKGLRCEECYPRAFGNMVDDSPENLYVYGDLASRTRCFCIQHMTFFNKDGAMKHFDDEDVFVGFGAVLMSEILKDFDELMEDSE